MDCRVLAFRQLPHQPKLFLEYLDHFERVKAFYAHPPTMQAVKRIAGKLNIRASESRSAELLRKQKCPLGRARRFQFSGDALHRLHRWRMRIKTPSHVQNDQGIPEKASADAGAGGNARTRPIHEPLDDTRGKTSHPNLFEFQAEIRSNRGTPGPGDGRSRVAMNSTKRVFCSGLQRLQRQASEDRRGSRADPVTCFRPAMPLSETMAFEARTKTACNSRAFS